MKLNLKRHEFTTRSADPTVVVEYEDKEAGIKITEFQNVYQTELRDGLYGDKVSLLGQALHEALEDLHARKHDEENHNDYLELVAAQLRDAKIRIVMYELRERWPGASYEFPGYISLPVNDKNWSWSIGINLDGLPDTHWTGALTDAGGQELAVLATTVDENAEPKDIADALLVAIAMTPVPK